MTDAKESPEWSYWDKTILAPMVRVGTLPFRKLASKYGADIVYSEEIIDKRILKCHRVEDAEAGVIRFQYEEPRPMGKKHKNKPLVIQDTFVTYPGEKVVFQMGTSDAESALAAARIVEKDVRAIDINMGCPKHFSVHAGMGCALLIHPENIKSILSTLVENLSIPVTCKIRLLDDVEETVALCKVALSCGISALAVHGRRPSDRPRHPAMPEMVKDVFTRLREESEVARNTPLIYNGDVQYNGDVARLKLLSGADAIMIARGAMWNASVFRQAAAMDPLSSVCEAYLQEAETLNNHFSNTKYVLQQMLQHYVGNEQKYQDFVRSKDYKACREALFGGDAKEQNGLLRLALLREPYVIAPKLLYSEPRPTLVPTKTYLKEYAESGGGKKRKKKDWNKVVKSQKRREMEELKEGKQQQE